MPTDEGLTGEDEFASAGPPWLLEPAAELPAADAAPTGEPPFIEEPASSGMDGLIILIKVFTEPLDTWYRFELGFSRANDNGSTMSAGI